MSLEVYAAFEAICHARRGRAYPTPVISAAPLRPYAMNHYALFSVVRRLMSASQPARKPEKMTESVDLDGILRD